MSSSSSSSSHNDRITAKRERACLEFMEATSSNMSTAKHYLKQTAYDLERAVSLYFDKGGETLASEDDEEDEEDETIDVGNGGRNKTNQESEQVVGGTGNESDDDPISAIMDAVKKEKPVLSESSSSSSPSPSFVGKGFSLNDKKTSGNNSSHQNDSTSSLKVIIVFYKDGFTAQEEKEEEVDKPATAVRLRGVHTISSSSSSDGIRRRRRLPPIRTYSENERFIQDIKRKHVPMEFRRLGSNNKRPIPVSLLLDDRRSTNYPYKEWEKQEQQETTKLFNGTGNTLGGGSGGSTLTTTANKQTFQTKEGLVAMILRFVAFWWNLFFKQMNKLLERSVADAPNPKHVVDPEKPTTTISLRLFTKRQKVVFNTDHTIDDVKRYCQFELLPSDNDSDNNDDQVEFELVAGFPPKVIDATTHYGGHGTETSSSSLKELGLLNSAIDIRLIKTTIQYKKAS